MSQFDKVRERIAAGLSVKAASLAPMSGMSPAAFYKAIDRGEIEAVKIGRSRLIPAHESRRILGIKIEPIAA